VLTEKIEQCLQKLFQEIAADQEFIVHLAEVGERDHLHIFASAHPNVALYNTVKMPKGIFARQLFLEFPLKCGFEKGVWNSSFHIETTGSISEDVISK
jgi:putative transposase